MTKLVQKIPPHIRSRGMSASTTFLLVALSVVLTWSLHYNLTEMLGHNARFFEVLPFLFDLDWQNYLGTILLIAGAIYKLKKMFGGRKA